MANNVLHESVEINGVIITPAILAFIKSNQEWKGEVLNDALAAMRNILFYAIKQSIEYNTFEQIQGYTVDVINFLEELKAFKL